MPANQPYERRDILAIIADEVAYRLEGNLPSTVSSQIPRVWSYDLILGHVRGGYDDLLTSCGLLWDVLPAEDRPALASINFPWEADYASSGWRWYVERRTQDDGSGPRHWHLRTGLQTGRATFSFLHEHRFTDVGNPAGFGPAAINFPWERDGGLSSASIYSSREGASARPTGIVGFITARLAVFSPLWEIPRWVIQIVRAAWNNRRVDALRSMDLERLDAQYETTRGHVTAYITDKDGHGVLRKFRTPSLEGSGFVVKGTAGILRGIVDVSGVPPTNWMHLDEWAIIHPYTGDVDYAGGVSLFWDFNPDISAGVLAEGNNWRALSYFANMEVRGDYGTIRTMPGYHPSKGSYGTIRKMVPVTNNTRVEVHRRSTNPDQSVQDWELPVAYRRYVRFYALWKCYEQDGPGQDVEIAQHFRERWEESLRRVKGRIASSVQSKTWRLGGPNPSGYGGVARPQLPANFARRFPRRR